MTTAAQNPIAADPAGFSAAKRRVALHSMAVAAAMTLLKLAAGLLSGSLGVLSDAAHSALDLVGVTLTFFSVRVSDKPADEGHTYGHGKIENLSAFAETGLMAVSCAWIIWEAMQRMISHTVVLHHSLWPVLVLALSIGLDWWKIATPARGGGTHGKPGAGDRRVPLRLRHLVDRGGAGRPGRELDRGPVRRRLATLCRPGCGRGCLAHDSAHDASPGPRNRGRADGRVCRRTRGRACWMRLER